MERPGDSLTCPNSEYGTHRCIRCDSEVEDHEIASYPDSDVVLSKDATAQIYTILKTIEEAPVKSSSSLAVLIKNGTSEIRTLLRGRRKTTKTASPVEDHCPYPGCPGVKDHVECPKCGADHCDCWDGQ